MVVLGLLVVVGWFFLVSSGCGRLFLVGHVGGSVCGVFIVIFILFYCVES